MKRRYFSNIFWPKLWLVLIFLGFHLLSNSQMLETKYNLTLSGGTGTMNSHESNIFFPDFVSQQFTNYSLTFTRKIFNWMDAGLSAEYMMLSSINVGNGYIKQLTSYKGSIAGTGAVLDIHLPYVRSGIWNRLTPKLQISPLLRILQSSRKIQFDNMILNAGSEPINPEIKMPHVDTEIGRAHV